MIFDVHCHLGVDQVFGGEITEDQVLKMFEKNDIGGAIIQPNFVSPTVEAQREAHNRVAEFIEKHPEFDLHGMASVNPHLPAKDYMGEVERCMEELNFIALKLHPVAHGCDPLMQDGEKAFQAANEFEIPLMVHTGIGSPAADPSHLLPRAKEFPEVQIVMAHLGVAEKVAEALAVMEEVPSMVADLSLVVSFQVPAVVEAVGPERLMFGSDVNPNCGMEIAKIRYWVKDKESLDHIFGDTARRVFKL